MFPVSESTVFLIVSTFSVIFIGLMVYAVFRAKENHVECWQLISSQNAKGLERADIDKIGKVVALFIITGVVIFYVATTKLDGSVLTLLGLFLTYAGGIAGYSAFLRSKQGSGSSPSTPTQ